MQQSVDIFLLGLQCVQAPPGNTPHPLSSQPHRFYTSFRRFFDRGRRRQCVRQTKRRRSYCYKSREKETAPILQPRRAPLITSPVLQRSKGVNRHLPLDVQSQSLSALAVKKSVWGLSKDASSLIPPDFGLQRLDVKPTAAKPFMWQPCCASRTIPLGGQFQRFMTSA